MYLPTISYSVSGTNPVICISPEALNILLKYIFPSLYISNVGASIILPDGSFMCNLLFAEYTSALNSSAVTSGFTNSVLSCISSLFSGFIGSATSSFSSICSSSLNVSSFSIFSCEFSTSFFAFSIISNFVNNSS